MFGNSTQALLKTKYDMDIYKYNDADQLEIIRRLIERNDKIIDINGEKIKLLNEIIADMSNYINGGVKVATK